jgi:hypothetical protein
MAALATVIMLVAWFPYVTYAVPCTAALTIMIVVIEYGKKAAFITYLVSVIPIMLFAENEAKLIYVFFAGFYPILKALFELPRSRVLEFVLKFLSFNASVGIIYLASTFVFGVSYDDLGELGKYGAVIFLVLVNFVFVAFDFCISKMATYYILRFHENVAKILKK